MKRWLLRTFLPPAIMLVVIIALTEVGVRVFDVSPTLLPPPSSIAEESLKRWTELRDGLWTTTKATVSGFVISAVVGIIAAVIMSSSRWIERACFPYTVLFQTVPIIAIAPILVIGLGAGYKAVTASVIVVALFPVIANTLAGIKGTDPALVDLFRLYKAGPIATLFKLKLPSALPQMFTGLRVASGLSVIGAVVGEYVAGQAHDKRGLGTMVDLYYHNYNSDMVFASVIVSSFLGIGLFGTINLAGWLLMRNWHAGSR